MTSLEVASSTEPDLAATSGKASHLIPRLRLRRVISDPAAALGGILLVVIAGAVLGASWLSSHDPTAIDTANPLAGPSRAHPFGTDGLGRDLLSRILHGGRTSVAAAAVTTVLIAVLGLFFGVCSGYLGGAVDSLVMRLVEVLQALPLLIVAMVGVGLVGGGTDRLVITVALLGWPGTARVVRAATLAMRETVFVDAARVMGATKWRIMFRHILPGVTNVVAAMGMIELGRTVLVLSALSFLGFGVRPPNPEWGAMLADARSAFFVAPKLLFIPGIAISLLVFAVNLVGDGVRDASSGRTGDR